MDFGEDVEYILETEDVAAFATVATDDNSSYNAPPAPPPKQTPQQQQQQQPQPQPQPQHQQHQQQHQQQQQLQQYQQSHQHQYQNNHHVNQALAQAKGTPGGKILLIPINSKSGTPQNIKHLFQLPSGTSPISMGQLASTVNKKQLIQLAPISSLSNVHKLSSLPQNSTSAASIAASPKTVRAPSPIVSNEVPKRKPCNCTKSQCLKLYCDCFANGEFCSGCNCTNCFNSLSKEKERQKAISQCLERNPEAFRPKIGKAIRASLGEPAPESIERRHTKGCNCKRSGCLKNYCECYEAKILCSNLCKCCGCKNYEESFERKSLMQLTNPTSEHARGILKNLLPTNISSKVGKEFTKCFITDEVIHASLQELLQTAQQAEKDGVPTHNIPELIQTEMGKCLRMIVDSASESSSTKKR